MSIRSFWLNFYLYNSGYIIISILDPNHFDTDSRIRKKWIRIRPFNKNFISTNMKFKLYRFHPGSNKNKLTPIPACFTHKKSTIYFNQIFSCLLYPDICLSTYSSLVSVCFTRNLPAFFKQELACLF